jgi:hypothetical protein
MFSNDMFGGMVIGIFLAGMLGMAVLGGIGYGIYWLWTHYDIVPQSTQCAPGGAP